MADNPVDNKAVDVLAAAAGVPTPAQARSLWATVWRFRKLALLLGGVGLTAAAGGYGYKYFTANPGKANAQADSPAVADRPDDLKPGDDLPDIKAPAPAWKDEIPPIAEIKVPAIQVPGDDLPDIKAPAIKPSAPDRTVTEPPALPALPPSPAERPKKPADDDLPDIAPPPAPEIKRPGGEPKRPAVEAPDRFKAADVLPSNGKVVPAPLPADMTETKERVKTGPVLPAEVTEPAKVAAPMPMKMGDAPDVPMVPKTDIAIPPPPPGVEKKGDSPADAKDDTIPAITAPAIIVPGPKPDVPPVVVGPKPDMGPEIKTPEVKTPEIPTITIPGTVKTPASIEPTIPPTDVKIDSPPATATRKDSYSEDWHTWKEGDTYALISQEYYHDAKYAAALDAYNKEHRKPGDKFVRVPDLWKLEELFPNLAGKADKTDRPEAKATSGGGLKFEPVAPLPGSGRPAPPAVTSSRSSDEYRVTAEAGETVREVARKALGDAGSWKKLYELNPGIDPTLPIPAGTTLRLR